MSAARDVALYGSQSGEDSAYDPFAPASPGEEALIEETQTMRRRTGGAFLWVALLMVATVGSLTWDQKAGSSPSMRGASALPSLKTSVLAESLAPAGEVSIGEVEGLGGIGGVDGMGGPDGQGGVDGEGGVGGVAGVGEDVGSEDGQDPDGESPDGEDPNGEDPDGEDPDGEDPDTDDTEDGSKKAN